MVMVGATTRWASRIMLGPLRRVFNSCIPSTPSTSVAIFIISCSISAGNETSNNSLSEGMAMLMAADKMAMLMQQHTMGSNTTHSLPKSMAHPIPIADPMDESASDLWCQALANSTGLLFFLLILAVYW